ncbi:site-specific integrase [Paraburkholderia terrae]|uniref:hypothetical protein n=1 Tax=Paraburkholderia terrae TaxID=311230 RepID=UPI00296ADE1D|nr:hypothetical protein [Paraburkholderia terrae]MDW3663978.1 hypothetical protein [Paraburkholderia terrae]
MLDATKALLDRIDVTTPIGFRDRALIALVIGSRGSVRRSRCVLTMSTCSSGACARGGARKVGKGHETLCHQTLEADLKAYLDGAGIGTDTKGPLFRTIARGTGKRSTTPLPKANA